MNADIFISYASRNREQVLPFVERLRSNGMSVWIDQTGIDAAHLWSEEIVDALDACLAMVLFASPESMTSQNVVKEVHMAMQRAKPILPVFLESVEIPKTLQYPLAGVQHIDMFRGDADRNFAAMVRSLSRLGVGFESHSPDEPAEAKPNQIERALRRLGPVPFVFRRQDVLDDVLARLRQGPLSTVLLHGLVGVGKTVLASEVVRAVGSSFANVWAIRLNGPAAVEPAYLLDELNGFLNTLGREIDPDRLATQKSAIALESLLEQMSDVEALFVLDAVDEVPGAWLETVLKGFETVPQLRLLVTARTRVADGIAAQAVQIPPLSEADAVEFAEECATVFGIDISSREVLRKLPQSVWSHPQALTTLMGQLNDFPLELLLLEGVPEAARAASRQVEHVISVLSPSERHVLASIALLAEIDLKQAITDLELSLPADFLGTFRSLIARSLVHRSGSAYSVPAIVCDALAAIDGESIRSAAGPLASAWKRRMESCDLTTEVFSRLASIAALAANFLAERSEWRLANEFASEAQLEQMNIRGCWKEYSLLLQLGIRVAQALGEVDRQIRFGCRLCRKLHHMGDPQGAERALAEAEALLANTGETLEHAEIHSHRGLLLDTAGQHEEARQQLVESRRIRELIGNRAGLVMIEKLIGNVHLRRKQYAEAQTCYERSLDLLQEFPNEKETIEVDTSLALCELYAGETENAESRLRKVIERGRVIDYSVGTARALFNLALVLERSNRLPEALQSARTAAGLAESNFRALSVAATMMVARLEEQLNWKSPT